MSAIPRGVDPYWDGVWAGGSRIGWVSRADALRAQAAGLGRLPAWWGADPAEALERLTSPRNLSLTIEALGAINQWRTISVEQLASLTGQSRLGVLDRRGRSLVAAMFAAGLVDYGLPVTPLLRSTEPHPGSVLVRPAGTPAFARDIAPLLTHPELIRVTAGDDYRPGRQADRHNLLAVEMGLRAAEHCEVSAVLGELTSTVDLLAYSGLGRPKPSALQSSADLTLIRADGLRVAVEITATVGDRFKRKVSSWARTLSDTSFDASGLVVVFVEAATPDRVEAPGRSVMYDIRHAIKGAVRSYPGSARDRVAERLAVASWRDFFPERHTVSPSLAGFTVERATGVGDDLWDRVDFLDVFDFPFDPSNPDRLLAVVDNSRALAGTPVATELRYARHGVNLARARLAAAGLDPLPVPPTATGQRRKTRVGGPSGFATAAVTPARLRTGRRSNGAS